MNPQNAIIGGNDIMDLPTTQVDERDLAEEKKSARFSKTEEFAKLKKYLEARILFYQQYLPDGREIKDIPKGDVEGMWIAANTIIGELKAVIRSYEYAAEIVKEHGQRKV